MAPRSFSAIDQSKVVQSRGSAAGVCRRVFLGSMLATLSLVVSHQTACGEITRIEIQKETAAAEGKAFGATGAYRILSVLAHGELDPADRHNAIINDLPLAPTNEREKVDPL